MELPRARTIAMLSLLALPLALACESRPPPAPSGIDPSVAPLPPPSAATSASTPSTPSTLSTPPVTAPSRGPADDPGALPQTKDKPAATSAALEARANALWDAVVNDEPDRAMPFFFPVHAYEQVKAIATPAADWRRRLVAAYKRDIHGLAKRLGSKAASARFVRLEVPEERARWIEPDEEMNKLGYWRVYGTRLVYELDGRERTFDISSLISWRGEWYVVHLTGFK